MSDLDKIFMFGDWCTLSLDARARNQVDPDREYVRTRLVYANVSLEQMRYKVFYYYGTADIEQLEGFKRTFIKVLSAFDAEGIGYFIIEKFEKATSE